jgi:hypothetical protein
VTKKATPKKTLTKIRPRSRETQDAPLLNYFGSRARPVGGCELTELRHFIMAVRRLRDRATFIKGAPRGRVNGRWRVATQHNAFGSPIRFQLRHEGNIIRNVDFAHASAAQLFPPRKNGRESGDRKDKRGGCLLLRSSSPIQPVLAAPFSD